MRVIANNLANVGTNGFKRDRANFATLAYQDARVAGQQSSTETAYATGLNLGTGVGVQSTIPELKAKGCFTEIIAYKTRVFVPMQKAGEVIGAIVG